MRHLPALLILASGAGGYVYTHPELTKSFDAAKWVSSEGESVVADDEEVERLAMAAPEELVAVESRHTDSFEKVFRFDLTPRMVTERWSRLSTGLGDVNLQGYRVPLVTGTDPTDLAGSLTYYFDSTPRMRRITFLGSTGDPARIIDFMARQYGFRQARGANPRVITYRTRYGHAGSLEITPAEVLDRDQAATNYRVELTISR
jgi:hypothetical protein